MTHSEERDDFIDSADSRETSVEIMIAIANIACSLAHAEQIWEDADQHTVQKICETLENPPSSYCWGAAGNDWL